jgi:hypothetical protein
MAVAHALLVDLDYMPAPLADGIYVFPSHGEALAFAVASLVEAGELVRDPDGTLWDAAIEEQYESDGDALGSWTDGLSLFNYYHLREVMRLPE